MEEEMATKLNKDQEALLEQFGLSVEEPEEADTSRKSKNWDKYVAACEVAIAIVDNKVNEVCVGEYTNPTQPYSLARDINNNERPEFLDWEGGHFTAHSHRVPGGKYKVWIKFVKD